MKDCIDVKAIKAGFEAGIKLGAALHQFTGIPISKENAKIIEEAIKSAILLQPFVKDARVKVNTNALTERISSFNYTMLSPEMLEIEVTVEVEKFKVKGLLKWREELNYPLMEVLIDEGNKKD